MPASDHDIDFRSMNRRTRTIALVGRYLQCWEHMEIEIDDAISKALNLTGIQTFIFGPNIPFHRKLHILWVLIKFSLLTEGNKARSEKVIKRMLKYSGDRNAIVHNLFSVSRTNDGVQFLVVKTDEGELKAPNYDWSISKFEHAFSNLQECADETRALAAKLTAVRTNIARLAAAITAPLSLGAGEDLGIGSLGLLGSFADASEMPSKGDKTKGEK
jgi:hypothetical protein